MLVSQPLQGIKGPKGLNPRKTADPNMQSRRKSKFSLPPGASWKRLSRSLLLETSATSPSDGYSFLICTVESHPVCLESFQKTQGQQAWVEGTTPPEVSGSDPHLAASSSRALAVERR